MKQHSESTKGNIMKGPPPVPILHSRFPTPEAATIHSLTYPYIFYNTCKR